MQRLNPIRASYRDLHDFSRCGIDLHFPIVSHKNFGDPFGGPDIDSLDVRPIERFESRVGADLFQHVREGNARGFRGPLFLGRLNPTPLLFDLEHQSGGDNDR